MNRFQVMANYIRASELLVSVAPAGPGRDVWIDHALDVAVRLSSYVSTRRDEDERDLMEAAILHAVLEDTTVTPEQIEMATNARVRLWVETITEPEAILPKDQWLVKQRMYAAVPAYPDLLLIKLADRISAVTECWKKRDCRLFEYYAEQIAFEAVMGSLLNRAPVGWVGTTTARAFLREYRDLFTSSPSPRSSG